MPTTTGHLKCYYQTLGGHTHIRVFMNGGKAGDLCLRNEEFLLLFNALKLKLLHNIVEFISENSSAPKEQHDQPKDPKDS